MRRFMSADENPRRELLSDDEPQRSEPPTIRMKCSSCGAHVMARVGVRGLSGQCTVCDGFELVPLEPDA
jgi:hypothetical protein